MVYSRIEQEKLKQKPEDTVSMHAIPMENKLIHGSHSCEPNPGPPGKNSSFKDKKNQ